MNIYSKITGAAHFLPERIVHNNDLEKLMDTSNEWIKERSGIEERRFVTAGTSTSEIALSAIANLQNKIALAGIDLIIAATLSPDYYFPGLGVFIQRELNKENSLKIGNIPALDLRAQCSGFVYGLATADAYIKAGLAKKTLLVCAEVQSPVLELTTQGRDMAVLFGDGAAAVCIESVSYPERPSFKNQYSGIIDSSLGSDGNGIDALCLVAPGTATKGFLSENTYADGTWHPHMDGRLVFKNAVTRLQEVAEEILAKNNLKSSDIDLLLPHQANLRINQAVSAKLGIPEERVFNNIHKYGNTTAATIPICLSEALEQGRLEKGMLVMSLAFGAGFTWGANIFRW